MTAFARVSAQHTWGSATWELRSVNHRYLDLSFKIPESFREWEVDWRQVVAKTLARGKMECFLTFAASEQTAPHLKINTLLVTQLLNNCQVLNQYKDIDPQVKSIDILRWPGVLMSELGEVSQLKDPLTVLLETAVQDLSQARLREGKQIQDFLTDKLAQVLQQVAIAKKKLPGCLQNQKQKLHQKLADLSDNLDNDRLEQEMLIYAQRIDVEEEISRLTTHVQEVSRILKHKEAMGRRLDFLMQELNREANTLSAKSVDDEITKAAIELKVLIEQMREQIQNVE